MTLKNTLSSFVGAWALSLALCCVSTSLSADTSYLQLASRTSQVATAENVNRPLPANLDTLDGKLGYSIHWDRNLANTVTINEDGVYFVMSVAQVGAMQGVPYKGADITYWTTLNGAAIADTGSWVYSDATARAKTIVCQTMVLAKKGDAIGFMFSSSSENGGLIARPATSYAPNASSLSVSIFKVN